jgi:hypothetical protein
MSLDVIVIFCMPFAFIVVYNCIKNFLPFITIGTKAIDFQFFIHQFSLCQVKLIQQPSKSEKYTASETSCSQVPEEMDIDIDENSQRRVTQIGPLMKNIMNCLMILMIIVIMMMLQLQKTQSGKPI